jgi:hypothetical protein
MGSTELDDLKDKLAKSICKILFEESFTVPGTDNINGNVYVCHDKISFAEESNTATASVTYITEGLREKKHTVNIKFKYDKSGKFIRSSMTYV